MNFRLKWFQWPNSAMVKRATCSATLLPKRVEIACVASVSNRVIARNLEQEQKKNGGRGRGRGEEETPSPPLSFLFFCSRPNFLD